MDFLMYMLPWFGFSLVVSGMMVFVSERKHLLAVLFSLEYIVLGIFMLLSFYLMMMVDLYFCLLFLAVAVCEGALGLSILVSLVRSHGSDYFMNFSVLQC
uniref:NADH-ubiquinone oxidoreductase chain 4L n=1 Tax=Songmachilis xinxiangensis TaxID=1224734 RepID=R4IJQ4_9INSE|nr:NADH dehydrogenase subunit 4L [Songmachilis xinxiangensis]AFQ07910.1 NADH dehydrogenase subunit 4L [Songmachilis xinxiangensis]